MPQILFVGGGLDSAAGVSISEITGFSDATYAPSALHVAGGQAGWAIFTCLDATLNPVSVIGGQTFYGHFGYNFTNPFNTTQHLAFLNDSAGFPWVAILSNGGSPTFGLYYNSGTGAAPVWTQLGANFAMPQNTGPYQRLDIVVAIGATGNHVATVYNKEVQVATGAFVQAAFTNIRTMQIFPGTGDCMIWEVVMAEGQSTVGARVGYSLANGAGSNAGWTGTFGNVSPVTCTDATSNTSAAAAQKTTYAFGDIVVPITNSLHCVWHWIRGKNDGANPSNIKSVCRSTGVDYPAAVNAPGIGAAFGPLPMRYDVDPATLAAWTQAGFNAAEFGYLSAA